MQRTVAPPRRRRGKQCPRYRAPNNNALKVALESAEYFSHQLDAQVRGGWNANAGGRGTANVTGTSKGALKSNYFWSIY